MKSAVPVRDPVAPFAQASAPAASASRALIDATRDFAVEKPLSAHWHVASTLVALAAGAAGVAVIRAWPLRLCASVLTGLLVVRGFVLFHDVMHGSLMRRSPLARGIFYAFGTLVLTPPRVWRETHNYHHAHTAKLVGSHVGSFPMVSTAMWRRMDRRQRLRYRAARHPLAIVAAYVTVFLYGMCLAPFLRDPRKNWDAGAAIVLHAALSGVLVASAGSEAYFFCLLLPLAVAHAVGAYLFYAQHNFPSVHVEPRENWSFTRAALRSSSYMPMGPAMRWLTGNIGYHHVHHLNPSIPFYRLPEAMAAIPGLQDPGVTTLGLRDVLACLRLKIWDPALGRMVGLPPED